MASVALLVGLGAMIGRILEMTGGAKVLADTLINRFGSHRAPFALGVACAVYMNEIPGPFARFVVIARHDAGRSGVDKTSLIMSASNRPGAVVRLPGIIMLVPGSTALRGVISLVQAQDIGAGQEAALAAINTLMALLAGLLFGNLLVSARRNL